MERRKPGDSRIPGERGRSGWGGVGLFARRTRPRPWRHGTKRVLGLYGVRPGAESRFGGGLAPVPGETGTAAGSVAIALRWGAALLVHRRVGLPGAGRAAGGLVPSGRLGLRWEPGARRRGGHCWRPCFSLARPGVRQAARQCRGVAAAIPGGTSLTFGYSGPAIRGRAFATARASGAQARSLTPSDDAGGAASAGARGRPGCRSGWWTASCGRAASAARAGRRRG